MGIVTNHNIINLTSRIFNQFGPELNELIIEKIDNDLNGIECGGSIREFHTSHLTEHVRAAFTNLAADLIGAFEVCGAQTEQMVRPLEADSSTLS
jgi:hypothetical protein